MPGKVRNNSNNFKLDHLPVQQKKHSKKKTAQPSRQETGSSYVKTLVAVGAIVGALATGYGALHDDKRSLENSKATTERPFSPRKFDESICENAVLNEGQTKVRVCDFFSPAYWDGRHGAKKDYTLVRHWENGSKADYFCQNGNPLRDHCTGVIDVLANSVDTKTFDEA
jgi:hypothetical protein